MSAGAVSVPVSVPVSGVELSEPVKEYIGFWTDPGRYTLTELADEVLALKADGLVPCGHVMFAPSQAEVNAALSVLEDELVRRVATEVAR